MSFNCRISSPSVFTYTLSNVLISSVDQHSYLGVVISTNMSFSQHISNITIKALKVFNFLRRSLYWCSKETKLRVYLSLVRPILKYVSTVWDPYTIKDSDQFERVQQPAARWVCSNYDWKCSVTSLLENLQWSTLKHRRKVVHLITFYKSIYDSTALKIPPYYSITTISTRRCHDMHYIYPPYPQIHINLAIFPA